MKIFLVFHALIDRGAITFIENRFFFFIIFFTLTWASPPAFEFMCMWMYL